MKLTTNELNNKKKIQNYQYRVKNLTAHFSSRYTAMYGVCLVTLIYKQ